MQRQKGTKQWEERQRGGGEINGQEIKVLRGTATTKNERDKEKGEKRWMFSHSSLHCPLITESTLLFNHLLLCEGVLFMGVCVSAPEGNVGNVALKKKKTSTEKRCICSGSQRMGHANKVNEYKDRKDMDRTASGRTKSFDLL